jgi:transformation/transcription domain-associated protein
MDLVDVDVLNKVHQVIWHPMLSVPVPDYASFEDEALRIELCHMSTLLVRGYSHMIDSNKKDVIKVRASALCLPERVN